MIDCVKKKKKKSFLPSDSHTNTVISDALPTHQDGTENLYKAYLDIYTL